MPKVKLTIEEIEVELSDIDYSASKYYPAVHYLRNGDPGYPEEGGFEGVDAIWKEFEDNNGNKVRVNILPLFDQQTLDEQVEEFLNGSNDENYLKRIGRTSE